LRVERQNVPVDFVGVFRSIETVLLEVLSDKESQLIFSGVSQQIYRPEAFRERDPTDFFWVFAEVSRRRRRLLDSLSQLILSGFFRSNSTACGSGWTTGNAT
jgi:hypothetical protein